DAPRPSPEHCEGVWPLEAPSDAVADEPKQHGQCDRAEQRGPGENLDALLVETGAGIPDQMADAAEHMEDQRPAEEKQEQAAGDAREEGLGMPELLRAR